MRRSLQHTWLPVVGTCAVLLGCANSHSSRYPSDPLLLSKKPIESLPTAAALPIVAQHEPRAPENLAATLALATAEINAAEARQRQPVTATPASLRGEDNDVR